jgi:SAM-dependent methyltransferase
MKDTRIKLNLGCGVAMLKGWINVDKYVSVEDVKKGVKEKNPFYSQAIIQPGSKFVQADIKEMPFPDNYADVVEMHEVIEHLPIREVLPALKEIYRVMKPGATFLFDCPSFDGLVLEWLEFSLLDFNLNRYISISETFFGNQAHDGEFHKCPFNLKSLNYFLVVAGFKEGRFEIAKRGTVSVPVGEIGPILRKHLKKFYKKGSVSYVRNDTLIITVKK